MNASAGPLRPLPGKEQLLPGDAAKFFTEPQYNRFPAMFVRLNAIDPGQLRELLTQGWPCMAPRHLA